MRAARAWGVPPTVMIDTARARAHGWTEKDVVLAGALTVYEDGLCRSCGHPLEECTAAEADPDNRSGTHRYEAGPPVRCWACTALAQAEEKFRRPAGDTRPPDHPDALHWSSARLERPVR